MKMNEILKKRIEEESVVLADKMFPSSYHGHSTAFSFFKEGAKYALSHQWISVEEALPELGEDVLVMFPDKSITVASRRKIFNECVGDVIVWINGGYVYHDSMVRYWMPIPNLNKDIWKKV